MREVTNPETEQKSSSNKIFGNFCACALPMWTNFATDLSKMGRESDFLQSV